LPELLLTDRTCGDPSRWAQCAAHSRSISAALDAKYSPTIQATFDLAQRLPGEAVVLCRSSPTKESQWNSYRPQSK
jgi:hypothetical protein